MTTRDPSALPPRIITAKERRRRIPYSEAHYRRLEAAGKVPKRVHLGEHRIGYLDHEVTAWIEARAKAR